MEIKTKIKLVEVWDYDNLCAYYLEPSEYRLEKCVTGSTTNPFNYYISFGWGARVQIKEEQFQKAMDAKLKYLAQQED